MEDVIAAIFGLFLLIVILWAGLWVLGRARQTFSDPTRALNSGEVKRDRMVAQYSIRVLERLLVQDTNLPFLQDQDRTEIQKLVEKYYKGS